MPKSPKLLQSRKPQLYHSPETSSRLNNNPRTTAFLYAFHRTTMPGKSMLSLSILDYGIN
jgi:hypothetical protein